MRLSETLSQAHGSQNIIQSFWIGNIFILTHVTKHSLYGQLYIFIFLQLYFRNFVFYLTLILNFGGTHRSINAPKIQSHFEADTALSRPQIPSLTISVYDLFVMEFYFQYMCRNWDFLSCGLYSYLQSRFRLRSGRHYFQIIQSFVMHLITVFLCNALFLLVIRYFYFVITLTKLIFVNCWNRTLFLRLLYEVQEECIM